MSTIADKLQDLVMAKEDMKSALIEKGVTPTGGLSTYADAVREIENELDCKVIYVPEGNNEDHTRKCEFYNSTYNYFKQIGNTSVNFYRKIKR